MANAVAHGHQRDGPGRAGGAGREHGQPFDSAGPADGRRRRPAHRLDQPVVAPAGDDRALRAQLPGDELERRMAVVVEAAHQVRVPAIADPEGVEAGEDGGEEGGRVRVQEVLHAGRAGREGAVPLVLRIEDPQRIALQPLAAVLRQAVAARAEPRHEGVAPRRPAPGVAQGVDLELRDLQHVQGLEDVGAEGDDLDVRLGFGGADDLGVDLMELAQPALLRTLVAEHGAVGEEPQGKLPAQAARDHRAGDAGRVLGTQRDLVAAAVPEGVHLPGDHVGRLAQGAPEHLGELEDGGGDLGEPVAFRPRPRRVDDVALPPAVLGRYVVGAADRPQAAHGALAAAASAAARSASISAARRSTSPTTRSTSPASPILWSATPER